MDAQLGQRFGDALKLHANLVRRCGAARVLDVYLSPLYPALQQGLRRLWTSLLRLAPRSVQLQEQLLLANVVEGLVSDWLPDLGSAASSSRSAKTVNYLREEAIHMLGGVSLRRESLAPTKLLGELTRQAIRHGVVTSEMLRRGGADRRVVTLLANLESRDIDLALVEEGVPLRAITRCRKDGSNDEIKEALSAGPRPALSVMRQPMPALAQPQSVAAAAAVDEDDNGDLPPYSAPAFGDDF